ncbi:YceI family protein [Streptomyces sp. NPDC020141]|uniref:YceI family protein n=1 Tax=Streptomyces sp. NPDC020141 TaxID=3365065 RepID=UPI003792B0D4
MSTTPATAPRAARTLDVPPPGVWHLDPLHSSIGFVARHLGFVRVHGRFTDAEGTLTVADPVEETTARVRIAAATVDTGVPARDRHLRSPEFLDTARHPVMEFRGHGVRRTEEGWAMDGDLTVAGVTRALTLDGRFLGEDVYPFTGGRRLGFTGRAAVDRGDFGVSGLPPLPGARIFVGALVDITLDISMIDHDIQPFNEQLLGRPQAL